MMAIIAAVAFALALILDVAHTAIGTTITTGTLVTAGLLCLALHLAGVGARSRGFWRSRR